MKDATQTSKKQMCCLKPATITFSLQLLYWDMNDDNCHLQCKYIIKTEQCTIELSSFMHEVFR